MIDNDALKKARQQPKHQEDPATEPQTKYIAILVTDRQVPTEALVRIKGIVERGELTKSKASEIIGYLKGRPLDPERERRDKNRPTIADIPPGRYAVQTGAEPEDITFWRVKDVRGGPDKEGGYRMIARIEGPNERPLAGQQAQAAIKHIHRAGVGNAAVLYGRKVGKCSQCNTRITNRLSRELGIGPVCGGRVYEDWQERVNRARTALLELGLDPRENVA